MHIVARSLVLTTFACGLAAGCAAAPDDVSVDRIDSAMTSSSVHFAPDVRLSTVSRCTLTVDAPGAGGSPQVLEAELDAVRTFLDGTQSLRLSAEVRGYRYEIWLSQAGRGGASQARTGSTVFRHEGEQLVFAGGVTLSSAAPVPLSRDESDIRIDLGIGSYVGHSWSDAFSAKLVCTKGT